MNREKAVVLGFRPWALKSYGYDSETHSCHIRHKQNIWINNDPVGHAFFVKGFNYTRSRALSESVMALGETYPRGFHSLCALLNTIVRTESCFLLLPGAISSYAI